MREKNEKVCVASLYEAPQVEIIEVAVEKGFATSGEESLFSLDGEGVDSGSGWWFE